MYQFKTELREKLLDGRTIKFMCEKIGISRPFMNRILLGNINTKKVVAYCIVKVCDKDAELEDYFIKVK